MSLKSTKSEQKSIKGCVVFGGIGAIIGGVVGYLLTGTIAQQGTQDMMKGMISIIGAAAGLFLGGILSFIVNIFTTKSEVYEEEF